MFRDSPDTEVQTVPNIAAFPPVNDTFVPLVERAPFGVTIWQKTSDKLEDFTLIYANVQALKESGSELATFLGKTVKEAFPSALDAPDKFNVPKAWMRALETGESIVIDDFPYSNTKKASGWYKGYFVPLTSELVA